HGQQPAVRGRARCGAHRDHDFLPAGCAAVRRVRGHVMEGRLARTGLRIWVAGVLLFLFVPIATICLYAFNSSNVQSWPIHGLSTKWFTVAWHDPQVRAAFVLSLKAGPVGPPRPPPPPPAP